MPGCNSQGSAPTPSSDAHPEGAGAGEALHGGVPALLQHGAVLSESQLGRAPTEGGDPRLAQVLLRRSPERAKDLARCDGRKQGPHIKHTSGMLPAVPCEQPLVPQ